MTRAPLAYALSVWPVRASALGLAGLWLNEIEAPLLGPESPHLLFGGWAGLVSFVWLGPAAGILTTLLSLAGLLVRLDAAGFGTLVYVIEGLAVRLLWRRLHSLALAAVLFWFGAGWLVDAVVYGRWLGIATDHVFVLFLKQVFNGTFDALVAELALRALGAGPLADGVALRQYVASRVAFLGATLGLASGVLQARGAYAGRLDEARARDAATARRIGSSIHGYLAGRRAPLGILARSIEKDWLAQGPGRSTRLQAFHAAWPEYLNVGLVDARGNLLDMDPPRNALGRPIDTGNLAKRDYFREARDHLRTAYGAVIVGRLHVREPSKAEPVLLIAEPLVDAEPAFRGALIAALDARILQRMLAERVAAGGQLATLFDRTGRVIASLDPRLAPGRALAGYLPFAAGWPELPRVFSYSPPPDDAHGRLGLDFRYSTYEAVSLAGWGLLVDRPAWSLDAQMRVEVQWILFLFATALCVLNALGAVLTRAARDSLVSLGRAAAATAEAHPGAAAAIEALARSPILEVREVRTHFDAMLRALAQRTDEAQQALSRSEQRFQRLVEATPDVIVQLGEDRRVQYVNTAAAEMIGQPREALLGRPHAALFPAEDSERQRRALDEAAAGAAPVYEERPYRFPAGERWLATSVVPLGKHAGWLVVSRDVTALKRSQALERERADRFNLLLAQTSDAFWIASADGSKFLDASPEFERLYGRPVGEFEANPRLWVEAVHPEDRPIAEASAQSLMQKGRAVAEYRIVRPDGSVCWVQDSKSLLRDEQGRTVLMGGISADITGRKRTEEERARLDEALQRSRRLALVGQLAGGVAHEFNNLLGVIQGYAEMLLLGLEPGDLRRERLLKLLGAVERAAGLTRRLLAFGRGQVLRPQAVDLNRTLAEATRLLRPALGENVELRLQLAAETAFVWVDPAQLDEVLTTLAANARDAMPEGGVLTIESGRVDSRAGMPGRYALVAVKDTGHGIDEASLGRLFEPFFTTKDVGRGTGLGLAAVQGIVEQSGGQLEVESAVGRGTVIRIYLPCLADAGGERPTAAEPGPPAPSVEQTVLVVEDDAALREVTTAVVESLGYRVLAAADGEQALAVAEQQTGAIDALLTDVVMPRMSGVELARRLLARRPGLAVVYVSGYPGQAVAEQGLPQEEPIWLAKPFTLDAVSQALREGLRRAAARGLGGASRNGAA
ncbi:MAG: PAS domain S-box protein [Vicinamibacteria bacterium]